MLTLNRYIKLDDEAVASPNLCDRFENDDLKKVGEWVWAGYERDKFSRSKWEKRTEAAMDLAMQITKAKNFPWPDCANIAFPLVTIGVMQFHARAYPAIITGPDVVQMRVVGDDPTGATKTVATRVGDHMSYQVLEEDQPWEEQHDRLLINVSVVGTAFKKSYYSSSKGHNVSELVMAKDLVLDYYAKSVDDCPRKTHIIPLFRNEIYERVRRGIFRDILEEAWYRQTPPQPSPTPAQANKDNRSGMIPPPQPDETTPFIGLEQHCSVDLDGDGYAEPYIITIEASSKAVLRITTRFDRPEDIERTDDGKIIAIRASEYFTKYPFIPSPDGGIYDVGFGVLLGPLNESTNSIINQLVDAGTMQNTKGGFLGRGAKIRGGVYTFSPLEWKRVDSTGDDLRKNIVPLEVGEPSAVLFQLLSLLINYTNRISGSTDTMVGENPGQNTPAETTRSMVEQGSKIYAAIFKRIWRAMKDEFKKLYILNGIYLPDKQKFGSKGQFVLREDYLGDPNRIVPAADPNITSDTMQVTLALAIKQSAMQTPGYNVDEVERRYLKAMKVDGIDAIFPGSDKMPPSKHPKIQIEEMRVQAKRDALQMDHMHFAAELMEEQRVNNAKITELEAQAVKMIADIQGDEQDRQINAVNSAIGVMKAHNESLTKRIDAILKEVQHARESQLEARRISGMEASSSNASAGASA